jgi:CPA2 family monovalent cation:H+ antiporter-2
MPEVLFFRDLVLAIAAALVGGAVAHRLGQPPLIGYLLGGIAIGPYTPGPVSELRHVATLADIGVMLLMFELGVEFPLARLRRVRGVAIGGGVLQIALTAAAGALVGGALGLALVPSVFLGAIVALSSTLVALKLLLERGEMESAHGRVVIGISLVQDLSLVPFLVLLPAWAVSGEGAWVPLVLALAKTLGLFLGVYVAARLVIPFVFRGVARLQSRELFLLTVILFVIGVTVGLSALGLSAALGAYLAGLVVSRSPYSRHMLAELAPSRDLFASLFFVSVGMLVDPLLLWRYPATVGVLVGLIVVLKSVVGGLVVRAFGQPAPSALLSAVLLAHVGELSFVLARTASAAGFIADELYGLILGAALISILVNPLLVSTLARWLGHRTSFRAGDLSREGPAPDAEIELRGHVVVCGAGRVGSELVSSLRARRIPYAVIELDALRVEELRRQGVPCFYGDARNLRVLQSTGVGRARLLAVTHHDAAASAETIREVLALNPSLKVIARAHSRAELERIRGVGATEVVMPEFEAGMEILRWTLTSLGLPAIEVEGDIRRRRAEFRPSDFPEQPDQGAPGRV